ncbi:MAG: FAD-dependent oxidoreductase [Haloarculaceae archaeon]
MTTPVDADGAADADRVAVIGAGAVGVTAARDLAARGADVTLFERDEVASGASGRAAGIVYDAFAEDRDAAVAARAVERFRSLDADGAIEFTRCPYLWFARAGDDRSAAAIREQVPRMCEHGREVELLDAAAVRERFPALDTDVEVAAVAGDAGSLDPESYVVAMADRARAVGVDVRTETAVALGEWTEAGVEIAVGPGVESFDAVLVAAGAHTKRVLADVDVSIAMKPYRVQALVTDPLGVEVPMTFDATETYYFRPRAGGLLVGDGTEKREVDPDRWDAEADEQFVADSRERVHEALGVEPGVRRAWAGLCTATPDRDPLVGPVDDTGSVFVATGWQGHGFMRSPALGEAVAEWMLGAGGGVVEGFDPRRFDGDEAFEVVEGMTLEE